MKPALVVALVLLLVVGGFMALDRTVLHWYSEESSKEAMVTEPSFLAGEVKDIVRDHIRRSDYNPYSPAHRNRTIACVRAEIRPNRVWVVTCEFRAHTTVVAESIYLLDDETGRIVD